LWVRLESQTMTRRAEWCSVHLAGQSWPAVGELARSEIRRMADFDSDLWREMMEDSQVSEGLPQAKSKDLAKWLLQTCAPSLGKELGRKKTLELWEKFAVSVATSASVSLLELGVRLTELAQEKSGVAVLLP
jgi:hypothetical protein